MIAAFPDGIEATRFPREFAPVRLTILNLKVDWIVFDACW